MKFRIITLKTADGKTEYVGQLGWEVRDRVGRLAGFKAQSTSMNYSSYSEAIKWVRSEIHEV